MSKKAIWIVISAGLVAGTVLSMILNLTINPLSAFDVPLLTLQAEKGHLSGPAQKNGEKVSYIGKNGGSKEGKVTFRNLDIPESGYYMLRFTYYSGSDDRYFDLTADGDSHRLNCPNSGGFDKKGTVEIEVFLAKNGELVIGSDWYAPDLDRIEVFYPTSAEFPVRTYGKRTEQQFKAGNNTLILGSCKRHIYL